MKDAQELSNRLYVLLKEIDEVYRAAEQAQQSAEMGLEEVEFLKAKTYLDAKAQDTEGNKTIKELEAMATKAVHGVRLRSIELLTLKRRYEHDANRMETEIGVLRSLLSLEGKKMERIGMEENFNRAEGARRRVV